MKIKRNYTQCYNTLEEGGWFFNIDEMKTMSEESHLKSLYYWIYHAQKQKETLSEDVLDSYNGWMEKFGSWKKRNIDNIHLHKHEGDDVHESFFGSVRLVK